MFGVNPYNTAPYNETRYVWRNSTQTIMTLPAENRVLTLPAEDRVLTVPAENRELFVPAEDRLMEVR